MLMHPVRPRQTSALRPRLQAALSARAALADRHQASETLIDLLASLQAVQSANAAAQACLDQGGQLEDVVPALQRAEALVNDETEPWKRDSGRYKKLKVGLLSNRLGSGLVGRQWLTQQVVPCSGPNSPSAHTRPGATRSSFRELHQRLGDIRTVDAVHLDVSSRHISLRHVAGARRARHARSAPRAAR